REGQPSSRNPNKTKEPRMKRNYGTSLLLAGALLLLGGCSTPGATSSQRNTTPTATAAPAISMCGTIIVEAFIDACTVKVGVPVLFKNTTQDGALTVCLGPGTQCQPNAEGPAELVRGVLFNPGDSHSFIFTKAGTYTIIRICTPSCGSSLNVKSMTIIVMN